MQNYRLQCLLDYTLKTTYNDFIGWALPTQQVCDEVLQFWQKHPLAKMVDMGAGSGLFCMMFYHTGIPWDQLIAVDKRDSSYQTCQTFWNILQKDDFEVDVLDIFFIAWGVHDIKPCLESYLRRGGWCVIILNELSGGCTFPSNYFDDIADWESYYTHVQGPASNCQEYLSINVRKKASTIKYCDRLTCAQTTTSFFCNECALASFFKLSKDDGLLKKCKQ